MIAFNGVRQLVADVGQKMVLRHARLFRRLPRRLHLLLVPLGRRHVASDREDVAPAVGAPVEMKTKLQPAEHRLADPARQHGVGAAQAQRDDGDAASRRIGDGLEKGRPVDDVKAFEEAAVEEVAARHAEDVAVRPGDRGDETRPVEVDDQIADRLRQGVEFRRIPPRRHPQRHEHSGETEGEQRRIGEGEEGEDPLRETLGRGRRRGREQRQRKTCGEPGGERERRVEREGRLERQDAEPDERGGAPRPAGQGRNGGETGETGDADRLGETQATGAGRERQPPQRQHLCREKQAVGARGHAAHQQIEGQQRHGDDAGHEPVPDEGTMTHLAPPRRMPQRVHQCRDAGLESGRQGQERNSTMPRPPRAERIADGASQPALKRSLSGREKRENPAAMVEKALPRRGDGVRLVKRSASIAPIGLTSV